MHRRCPASQNRNSNRIRKRNQNRNQKYKPHAHREGRPCRAKRVLAGQITVAGVLGTAMLFRELPGLVREIRIWRMAGFRAGPRHPG
jgi:hypothetical protein